MSNEEKNKKAEQIVIMLKSIGIQNFIFADVKNEIIIGEGVSALQIVEVTEKLTDQAVSMSLDSLNKHFKNINNQIKNN